MILDLAPDWLAMVGGRTPEGGPSGADWLRTLPTLVDQLLADWQVTRTGPARTGCTALVLPVERSDMPLALKIGWPHTESAPEHLALRHWAGRGAARLVAADPARGALLLERLDPDRTLAGLPAERACAVAGSVLARLHVPAPASIPSLTGFVQAQMRALGERGGIPRRLVTRTQGLARELLAEPGEPRLLHGDLHYDNVLAGEREAWLAIDPKPLAGHPGFELQPLLRNRIDDLGTGSAFRWGIRRRLEIVAEAAGVDEEAMRLWSLVRTGIQLGWAAGAGDAEALSLQVAIHKALDD